LFSAILKNNVPLLINEYRRNFHTFTQIKRNQGNFLCEIFGQSSYKNLSLNDKDELLFLEIQIHLKKRFSPIRTASFVYNFHAVPLVDFFDNSSGKTNQKTIIIITSLVSTFQLFAFELQPKLL
jgi:hypothetical protein